MGTLLAYRRERLPAALLATVPTLLALAARMGGPVRIEDLPADIATAALMFAALRLLDDLADRDVDRLRHPDRVLSRADALRPFDAAAAGLSLLTACVVGVRVDWWPQIVPILLLLALNAAWAARGRAHGLGGDHLLLAKYPAMVWALSRSRDRLGVFLPLMATYLVACLYEALHDRHSPAASHLALLTLEGLALAAVLTLLTFRGAV